MNNYLKILLLTPLTEILDQHLNMSVFSSSQYTSSVRSLLQNPYLLLYIDSIV